jgi:RAD51-like protein 3
VTELTGEAGTGKTQLCMSAAASAAALGHRVVYVDTSGSFSAARVKAFHRGFVTADAAPAEVEQHLRLTLGLITVVRVHDVLALFKVLEELGLGAGGRAGMPGDGGLEGRADLAAVGEQMGLLVVDSLSSLLSPLITRTHHQGYTVGFFERNSIPGRPSAFPASPPTTRRLIHPLSSTQAFVLVYFACGRCYLAVMASVASLLRSLAPVHNCAVMYTNHTVSAGNSGGGGGRGASIKPALGIRWTSTPHRRLCLSRNSAGAGSQCLAEIIYGPGTGVRTVFQVVGDGIRTLDGQAP